MNHLEDGIDSKVDKVEDSSTFNRVYGVDTNGKQKIFNISKAPKDSALGQYTSAGNLVTNDPTAALHAANKRYVDGRFDYVVLSKTQFIKMASLDEDDRHLLLDFYNKHYEKTKIPLFAIDKNGVIATIAFRGAKIIELSVWSSDQSPIVFLLSLSVSKVTFSSCRVGYLHDIFGKSVWENDIKARIGVDSNNKLIITDEAGNQTPGQEPSVLIPPFTNYKSGYNTYFKTKSNLSSEKFLTDELWLGSGGWNGLRINNWSFINYNGDSAPGTYGFGMYGDSGVFDFYFVQECPYSETEPYTNDMIDPSQWKYAIKLPKKSGTVALTSDITSALENNLSFGTNTDIDNMF